MAITASELIRKTKIEFLKNNMNLIKMGVSKKVFEQLKAEWSNVIYYSIPNNLKDNEIRCYGITVYYEED